MHIYIYTQTYIYSKRGEERNAPVEDDGGLGRRHRGFLRPERGDGAPHLFCFVVERDRDVVGVVLVAGGESHTPIHIDTHTHIKYKYISTPTQTPHLHKPRHGIVLRRLLVLHNLLHLNIVGGVAPVRHAPLEVTRAGEVAGAAIFVFVLLICVMWDIYCVIVCVSINHTCYVRQDTQTRKRTGPAA